MVHPGIAVLKTATPTIVLAGQLVTYQYVVSNTGDTALGAVTVADDKCALLQLTGGDVGDDGVLGLSEAVDLPLHREYRGGHRPTW